MSQTQVCYQPSAVSVAFDEPNPLSSDGLLPVMTFPLGGGVPRVAEGWLSVPADKGAQQPGAVAPLPGPPGARAPPPAPEDVVLVDFNDTIISFHGYAKRRSGYGSEGSWPERTGAAAVPGSPLHGGDTGDPQMPETKTAASPDINQNQPRIGGSRLSGPRKRRQLFRPTEARYPR
jgi:hypothetical protein